jgi:hypothetical protein
MVANLSVGGLVARASFWPWASFLLSFSPPVQDLFICAKDLMFEANFRRTPPPLSDDLRAQRDSRNPEEARRTAAGAAAEGLRAAAEETQGAPPCRKAHASARARDRRAEGQP